MLMQVPCLTDTRLLSESTSFTLSVHVQEKGTNYSIGCFHIILTYVYGIKFISEKKYWTA